MVVAAQTLLSSCFSMASSGVLCTPITGGVAIAPSAHVQGHDRPVSQASSYCVGSVASSFSGTLRRRDALLEEILKVREEPPLNQEMRRCARAWEALTQEGQQQVLKRIVEASNHADIGVRQRAIDLITRIFPHTAKAERFDLALVLINHLVIDPDEGTAHLAFSGLLQHKYLLSPREALALIMHTVLRPTPFGPVRERLCASLMEMVIPLLGDEAGLLAIHLEAQLKNPDAAIRALALSTLGQLKEHVPSVRTGQCRIFS